MQLRGTSIGPFPHTQYLISGVYKDGSEVQRIDEWFVTSPSDFAEGYGQAYGLSDLYCSYTSPDPTPPLTSAGRIVGPDLILYKGQIKARPVAPVYKLPKRKKLVEPRILRQKYLPGIFVFRDRRPSETPEKFASLVRQAENRFEDNERRRLMTRVRLVARVRLNWEAKLFRRALFVERYNIVFARRKEKYERRLALFEKRRERLLSKKVRAPGRKTSFHEHSLVILKGVNLVKGRIFMQGSQSIDNFSYDLYSPNDEDTVYNLSDRFATEIPKHWSVHCFPSGLLASLHLVLETKLLDKLRRQDFHAGNFLAQYAQTIELLQTLNKGIFGLLSGPGGAVRSFLQAVRKNKTKVADLTLAYEFGLVPLVSDLKGLWELLRNPDLWPETAGKVTVKVVTRKHYRGQINIGPLTLTVDGVVTVRRAIHYKVKNPLLTFINQLGLYNAAEVVWEVLPWSFVIDWFSNVSELISSMTAEVGLERLEGNSETISFRGIVLERGPSDTIYSNVRGLIASGIVPFNVGDYYGELLTCVSSTGSIRFKQRRLLAADVGLLPHQLTGTMAEFGGHRIAESASLVVQQLRRLL